jgi:hypothetical protein
MKYILILILFITGCCPKITEHTTIQRDTTISYVRDTITIPEIKEVYVANIQELCDSINKKNKTTWEKIQYTIRGKKNNNSTLKIIVDTSQNAEFIATINNYEHIADSLREVIKISESRNTTQITNKCDSKFHIFCVWIFFLVVMCVALYIVTRK